MYWKDLPKLDDYSAVTRNSVLDWYEALADKQPYRYKIAQLHQMFRAVGDAKVPKLALSEVREGLSTRSWAQILSVSGQFMPVYMRFREYAARQGCGYVWRYSRLGVITAGGAITKEAVPTQESMDAVAKHLLAWLANQLR